MKKLHDIFSRMVAVFIVGALGTLGAGAVMGVDTWVALSMAGLLAVASVAERLAREYLDDGKLTLDEINGAFSPFAKSEEHGLQEEVTPSSDEAGKSKPKRRA
jgi:hypothetical protein